MENAVANHKTRSLNRKHDNWYYLEKLPARLRQALCNAAFAWDAKWFYDHWNKGRTVDWCIAKIKEWDLLEASEDVKWRNGFKWQKVKSATKETKIHPLYTNPPAAQRRAN